MYSKICLVIGTSILGMLAATLGTGTQDPQDFEKDSSAFMQRKLDYTRDIVDGLATENFEKISKGAEGLKQLSHESDWKVIASPEYSKMSNEFRVTTERLRQQGQQENLDGATLAYFEVTLNCIRCHRELRQAADPVKRK